MKMNIHNSFVYEHRRLSYPSLSLCFPPSIYTLIQLTAALMCTNKTLSMTPNNLTLEIFQLKIFIFASSVLYCCWKIEATNSNSSFTTFLRILWIKLQIHIKTERESGVQEFILFSIRRRSSLTFHWETSKCERFSDTHK